MTFSLQITTAEDRAAQLRGDLREAVRAARDAAINSGTEVGGSFFHTDDISQGRILAASQVAAKTPDFTIRWKTVIGDFVTLDAGAVSVVADAVWSHVQICFAAEESVLAEIGALTAGELSGFDARARYETVRAAL